MTFELVGKLQWNRQSLNTCCCNALQVVYTMELHLKDSCTRSETREHIFGIQFPSDKRTLLHRINKWIDLVAFPAIDLERRTYLVFRIYSTIISDLLTCFKVAFVLIFLFLICDACLVGVIRHARFLKSVLIGNQRPVCRQYHSNCVDRTWDISVLLLVNILRAREIDCNRIFSHSESKLYQRIKEMITCSLFSFSCLAK